MEYEYVLERYKSIDFDLFIHILKQYNMTNLYNFCNQLFYKDQDMLIKIINNGIDINKKNPNKSLIDWSLDFNDYHLTKLFLKQKLINKENEDKIKLIPKLWCSKCNSFKLN